MQKIEENNAIKAIETNSAIDDSLYKPLVVVGPSGVGKGTLIKFITTKTNHKDLFCFSVSYTTRQPRKGEIDGVHYNFVTPERFNKMAQEDQFVEYCEVHNNLYGTAKHQITEI